MKTKVVFNAVALSLKENIGKNGNKYYQISIDQDGEAGTIGITEEVYLGLKDNLVKYKPYQFTGEFNDSYGSMRVINAQILR